MLPSHLRDHLRHATSDQHARLDAQFGALDLTGRAGYRAFLEASAAALMPLEDALEAAGVDDVFPDWEQRSRRTAMLDDLARVGGTARPLKADLSLDAGAVLGVMYVLEGSRLGARYLLKTVAKSSDPVVTSATRYLAHGADGRLWQSFLVMLERHAAALSDDAGAIAGARQAFDLFEQAAAPVA